MRQTPTLFWLARHEFSLAWREWSWFLAGRKAKRARQAIVMGVVVLSLTHLLALLLVEPIATSTTSDRFLLLVITACALFSWCTMLTQAVELLTRSFYARGDLDLLLSSPISPETIFALRVLVATASATATALLWASPLINALAILGGAHWLGGYVLLLAMGATATGAAVALCLGLIGAVGARRARVLAQVAAAVIAAAFVIGVQVVGIVAYGTPSRDTLLRSEWLLTALPDVHSFLWWPARAAMGDPIASLVVLGGSVVALLALIWAFGRRFDAYAAAASVAGRRTRSSSIQFAGFGASTQRAALRRKEWTLLRRDPWLMSQALMQVLYLIPPALLLWKVFQHEQIGVVVVVSLLVMAAAQLAGGLTWLTVSGEEAPDVISTAPVTPSHILRAKVEAVFAVVGLVFAPFVAALLYVSPTDAFVSAAGICVAAGSATMIHLWYKGQAKRRYFRHRHVASRVATLSEAFSSVAWAAAFGLLTIGSWFAVGPAFVAMIVLLVARMLKPETL